MFGNVCVHVEKELEQVDDLLNRSSVLYEYAKWKVLFGDDFRRSFGKRDRLKKLVLNLLVRLSTGWRPKNISLGLCCENSSKSLEQFNVEGLYIICALDIIKEIQYVQVMKVWDILPYEEIPKLTKRLENIFSAYTEDYISRCTEKLYQGNLEVPRCWSASQEIIRFRHLVNDKGHNEESVNSGGVKSKEKRDIVYTLFKIYEKMKSERGDSDLGDFVNDIHQRLSNGNYEGDLMDFVYIDEVQDLSMRQISLFKYICQNVEKGFMFAGDTAQTIARGIDFSLVMMKMQSVVEIVGFGAEQVILVRDDHARTEITEYVGRKALVLTILECKGLEFQVAVLVSLGFLSTVYETSESEGVTWAVLVARSKGRKNYPFEANISGAYHVLKRGGVKDKKHHCNDVRRYCLSPIQSEPGKIFHFWGKDVYIGVPKHYTSKDVTAENFLAVLAGDEKTVGAKEVVKLTPKDHVFIYYAAGHGEYGTPHIYLESTVDRNPRLTRTATKPTPTNHIFIYYAGHGDKSLLDMPTAVLNKFDLLATLVKMEQQQQLKIQYGGNWPKLLRASADQILGTNHESYLGYLREATGMYESVGKLESAALCYYDLGDNALGYSTFRRVLRFEGVTEYGRAGKLYLYKCGKMDAAAECFSLAGCYSDAAEAYANEISFPTVCQFAKRENFLIEGCCRNQESLHFTIVEPRNKIRE
ncbi:UvrD-like helicase, ATP-binding domain, P-loop containing nucleoside triphosphate hydrolase [Tanacetum coccineum]